MIICRKAFFFILFLIFPLFIFGQIKGRVTAADNTPIAHASVSILNSYHATSTNSNGEFELAIPQQDSCTLLIQHLGYASKKVHWTKENESKGLPIILATKEIEIDEVVIQKQGNLADQIIKKTIAHRMLNRKTVDQYEADFYSKGSMRLVNIPKKILGRKVDAEDYRKETGGSNILYLSETISRIKVERPKKMYEYIVASKVSGNDQGLSFNRADGSDFELYSNYISFDNMKAISPIADQAFSYYTYKLIHSFDEENQTIYKIKVTAKRSTEPVFDGFIYIVADTWQIYAAEINILGSQINIPIVDTLFITQQYTYNQNDNRWIKQLQILNLSAGVFQINVKGQFTQTFSNYNFNPNFTINTFSEVITEFNEMANSKNDQYWQSQRKIPLSKDEIKDYFIKDSIRLIKENRAYLDSLDAKKNKFKLIDILGEYNYQNTSKKLYLNYESPISIERLSFNTVQVWNIKAELKARLGEYKDKHLTTGSLLLNYQFGGNKLYAATSVTHRFNRTHYNTVKFSIGTKAEQFNSEDPIGPFINMLSSLLFKENYMKLYESRFLAADYAQYLFPNIKIETHLNYQTRNNLYNRTSYSFSNNDDKGYTSNNPLESDDPESNSFINHTVLKGKAAIDVFFGTKIEKLPNKQINYIHNNKYPQLTFTYTSTLYSSIKNYKYQEISTSIKQDINFGNKGLLGYKAEVGTFFKGKDIAFIDYQHFNGNRTHIATSKRYLNTYLLLPYYNYSTNKSYLELHTEYNFQGYLLNKIPAINRLNWNTHIGYHLLSNSTKRPYQEFTVGFGNIGWGKYRFFRIDYVHTRNGMFSPNGIVVGVSFLDALLQN